MLSKVNKLVVVGGSAAGAACATRSRRLSEELEIVVIEKTKWPSYASCGMPYYIGQEIEDRDNLLVTPMPLLELGYKLTMKTESEATKIDPVEKYVEYVHNGETFKEPYDKLLLATGADPFFPPVEGMKEVDERFVHSLGGMHDMDRIYERSMDVNSACVVGGGFIGLEVAEQLRERGLEVSLVEILPHLVPPCDNWITKPVQTEMEEHGIAVMVNSCLTSVEEVEGKDEILLKVNNLETCEQETLNAGMVIMATGVRPNTKLAKDAGIETDPELFDTIIVDDHLRTNFEDIYACGDLIQTKDFIFPEYNGYTPLANIANIHGRLAANHMFGEQPDSYKGTVGPGIFQVFDKTVSMIGWSEEKLQKHGIKDYHRLVYLGDHRPGYMPLDSKKPMGITAKLLFDDDGKILGFQGVGEKGVYELSSSIAVAMNANLNVFELENMEFPYCPKYGGARNNVNHMAMVACGILKGTHQPAFSDELADLSKDAVLIDIRPPEMFEMGSVPGSINIPFGKLRKVVPEKFEKDKEIILVCNSGKRAYWASRALMQRGYSKTRFLSGSFMCYQRHFA